MERLSAFVTCSSQPFYRHFLRSFSSVSRDMALREFEWTNMWRLAQRTASSRYGPRHHRAPAATASDGALATRWHPPRWRRAVDAGGLGGHGTELGDQRRPPGLRGASDRLHGPGQARWSCCDRTQAPGDRATRDLARGLPAHAGDHGPRTELPRGLLRAGHRRVPLPRSRFSGHTTVHEPCGASRARLASGASRTHHRLNAGGTQRCDVGNG